MVNLFAEGWKAVKVVSISAVECSVEAASGEIAVNLTHHRDRAGLWDAAWRRRGAQSMFALRCLLLSERWHELPLST